MVNKPQNKNHKLLQSPPLNCYKPVFNIAALSGVFFVLTLSRFKFPHVISLLVRLHLKVVDTEEIMAQTNKRLIVWRVPACPHCTSTSRARND